MSRQSSPSRDNKIIKLASDIAEARDRRVPILLLSLKEILSHAPAGSAEAAKIRKDIWDYDILSVLILVLKQDYGLVDGDWQTAAAIAAIISQVCSGMDLKGEDLKKFEDEVLPTIISNLFLLARRIQNAHARLNDRPGHQKDKQRLNMCYRGVLESINYIASGRTFLCRNVMECPWLLQLLISDEPDTVISLMDLIPKILRLNRRLIKDLDQKLLLSVLDELVYKISVNTDASIGGAATKCILKICDINKDTINHLCTRYRGLRHLLSKWENKGFSKDLKDLQLILAAGNAMQAESEQLNRAALRIQTLWRGYITRMRMQRANRGMAKLQSSFRKKKNFLEKRKREAKEALELQRQLQLNRQKIMRDYHEKQMQALEILPADRVETYLQKEQQSAASCIQRVWRGHHVRASMETTRNVALQVKAAVKIQQGVRRWLERLENRRKKVRAEVRPPGLTDERRVELQKVVQAYREENPARYMERDDLENVHKKATDMLARYYATARRNREAQHHRKALMARIDTDAELLQLAPSLKDAGDKELEIYSSRSVPVATKAKADHTDLLRIARKPWYKKLIDEYQDQEYEEEEVILF